MVVWRCGISLLVFNSIFHYIELNNRREIPFLLVPMCSSSAVIRFIIYMASSASGQDETKSRAMIGYPSGQDGAF